MSMERSSKQGAAEPNVKSSRHDPRREYARFKAFEYKVLSHVAYKEYLQRKPLPPIPVPPLRPATKTASSSRRRQYTDVYKALPSTPRTVVRRPVRSSSGRSEVLPALKQPPAVLEDAWRYREQNPSPVHDKHLHAHASPAKSNAPRYSDGRRGSKGRTAAGGIRVHTASKPGTHIAPSKPKSTTGNGKPDKRPSPPVTPILVSGGQGGGRLADLGEKIRRLSGSLRSRADSFMSMHEQSPEGVVQKSSANQAVSQFTDHKREKVAAGLKIRHVHPSADIHVVSRDGTSTAENNKNSKQDNKGHRRTRSSPITVPNLSPWSSPKSSWSSKANSSPRASGSDINAVGQHQISPTTRVRKARLVLSNAVLGLVPRKDDKSVDLNFSFGAHQPMPTVNLNRCVRCGRSELDWLKAKHELCGECCKVEVGLGWPF